MTYASTGRPAAPAAALHRDATWRRPRRDGQSGRRSTFAGGASGFVLPVVVFFAVFSVFPVFFGFYLSLTDYDLLSPPLFVGLDNFRNLVSDKLFLTALVNTLIFVVGATVPVWAASLAAALLFDQVFRGRDVVKAIFFLPVLPPAVVIAVIWRLLLHPNGIATSTVGWFSGISEIPWLANTVLAPLAMIVVHDWAAIPFFMLIWLAGLAGIPQEVRDAAAVDGAGALRGSGTSTCRCCVRPRCWWPRLRPSTPFSRSSCNSCSVPTRADRPTPRWCSGCWCSNTASSISAWATPPPSRW